jgi:hypothetical protein
VVLAAAIVTMVIVFAIAAGAVGREAHLLDAVPARPVFDPDEATTWIADRLSPQAQASLSYPEVGQVVSYFVDWLREAGGVARTSGEVPDVGQSVFDENEMAGYIVDRAVDAGLVADPQHVYEVTLELFVYLETIGAIGPEGETEEPGERRFR